MHGHSRGIRRWFGLFGALWVLALPGSQYAHGAAMMHAGCPMMPGHMAQSAGHSTGPFHDASCCDLCFACCTVTALVASPPVITLPVVVSTFDLEVAATGSVALHVEHLLPFSQAPPRSSV